MDGVNGVDGGDGDHLRILIAAESFLPAVNGVTNSVLRLVDHAVRRGHEPQVIAPGPGPSNHTVAGIAVPIHRVRSRPVPRYRSLRIGVPTRSEIDNVVSRFRPDVVHLAAPVILGRQVGLAVERLRIPSVALFQTDLSGFGREYGVGMIDNTVWQWLRRVHNRADLTLAPTPTVADGLANRGFRNIGVWGRGVDQDQFSPDRRSDDLRRSWGVRHGRSAVGFVGRLAREKNVSRLAVLAGDADVQLVIVGDGPQCNSLVRSLPGAHFTGFLDGDDLGAAMASLDVMVHTGEHETFCQTVQEAMAAGTAVVAPASGGPLDLIDHGVDGLLFRPGVESDLRDQVRRLVDDTTLRQRLVVNGRAAVRPRTWDALGDQMLDHYRTVVRANLPVAA